MAGKIISKPSSKEYRDNFDRIFRKKEKKSKKYKDFKNGKEKIVENAQ